MRRCKAVSDLLLAGALVCLLAASACASPSADTAGHTDAGTAALDAELADAPDAELEDSAEPPCEEPEAGLPEDVFCTGLYLRHDAQKHAPSAIPYKPGVTLWSDGADKSRYLYLPPATQIDTSDMDAWKFPVGTKAWKEFRVDGALVETRLLWKRDASKWESGTYVWNASGTEAPLNGQRKGTILASGYEIPTARDCGKCHHGGSDQLLGVEAVALALPAAEGVTLTRLATEGRLSHAPSDSTIALPEDSTGKAALALGYLHANCGMPCHSSRGLGDETRLVLRLRAGEFWPNTNADAGAPTLPTPVAMTDIYRATVDQDPTTASVAAAFPGARRITPGSHEQSLIWLLAHVRGNYQMPPLVSHRVDEVGTQALADWIDALAGTTLHVQRMADSQDAGASRGRSTQ
jgi:hypothetical protein